MGKSLYERMKARGIDMGWYERGKAANAKMAKNGEVPIYDIACDHSSLYLWRMNGELWTYTTELDRNTDETIIKPYKMVRPETRKRPEDAIVCMHCRKVFNTLEEAEKHYAEQNEPAAIG